MSQPSKSLKPIACPVCAGHAYEQFDIANFPIAACQACSHTFADVIPSKNHVVEQFSDDYFFGGGTSGYQNYLTNAALVQKSAERYARIVDQHCKLKAGRSAWSVLDVGCAAGFIMQGFRRAGWTCTGIDPNQTMVEQSRLSGFEAHVGTLENALGESSGLPTQAGGSYDLISMIQVIAHLSDISVATRNLRHLLRDDGYVLLETWDSASITAKLLGRKWHEYSPPNVLHYFSTKSLDKTFADAGFEYVAGGRPAKRINLGHARSLFDFKYGNLWWGKTLVKMSQWIPGDLTIPYPAEDLVWRIYQKRPD